MSYFQKYMFQKKTEDINVKAFNMITNKNEAKVMIEHISCDCKCKFNSPKCNSKQKSNNKTCQCECKNCHKCEKDYSWNPNTCICESSKYLKGIADTTVTKCDEIVIAINNLSTKKTNTITTNVTSTASINCHSKKVRLVVIILLLIVTIICYQYAKQKGRI